MTTMNIIHMSFAKIYRVAGVTFDWHDYCGPVILNRHTEKERQFKNISLRNWAAIGKFCSMSDKEKELHRVI